MNYDVKTEFAADAIALFTTEGTPVPPKAGLLGERVPDAIAASVEGSRFNGKAGQIFEMSAPEGTQVKRILVIGLGKADAVDHKALENAGARAAKKLLTSGYETLSLVGLSDEADQAHLLMGARLACYRFDGYFTKQPDDQKPSLKTVSLIVSATDAAAAAWTELEAIAEGTETARDLMNEPPNVLHPESFADRVKEMEALGLKVTVLGEAEMTKLGMGSLLGVGQGSIRESKLAVMEWSGGGDEAPLALVGKGVCFDTGGISLKPGPQMEDMKGDMGGAAAVTGAMKTLAKRKAKANVVGLIGLVENMPDGNAQRPGDIVTSMSGQTIEIQNTDAEGRLVLADVLTYAQETYKPRAVVDLATLTGAIVISLGHENAGLFSNDDDLSNSITTAGKTTGETVWRLPLGAAYDRLIKSKFADMRNIGGRSAGSITAAQFLQRFIKEGTPWAHIDIAGVAWKEGEKEPADVSWASGFGPRLLNQLVKDSYEG